MSACTRIVQVVPRIADQSSGPSQSVPGLSRALQDGGNEVDLFVLEPLPARTTFSRTTAFPCLRGGWLRRLGVSPKLKAALRAAARRADVIHTNSLWMMPSIYPRGAIEGTNCRLVVSPRGTLSEWSLNRARCRKKIIDWYGQGRSLRRADCIHVTSEAELQDVRRYGLRNPGAVVPNGLSCPDLVRPVASQRTGHRRLLFLSRIHPKKGVDDLLHAWVRLEDEFPDWELQIAGPEEHSYAEKMKSLATTLRLSRVSFVGEVIGEAKSETFRAADLFVLPTHNENFGIAVAEALAHGVPVIVSTAAPWAGVEAEGCGWWFETSRSGLSGALRDALGRTSTELGDMGARGHEWVRREFAWEVIGDRMSRTYRWLCGRGDRPEFVHTSGE